jgi:hypothetical protein
MSNIEKRLDALEQAATAKNGHVVVCSSESNPGVYWRLHAPEDTFGQDVVDVMAKTKNVISIEYVQRTGTTDFNLAG